MLSKTDYTYQLNQSLWDVGWL